MAFTYGFYNSRDGDRKYDAIQMSSIFDGIIRDGILMHVGDHFNVVAIGGFAVTVGSGRAWLNHTWSYNDSKMSLTVAPSDPLLDRIDAIVIEVDAREEFRMNGIKWVYGEASTIPERPTLIRDDYHNQYPLAYVRVNRGVGSIQQADITNMVGTTDTPYVTAPLDAIDISQLVAQWNNQWDILLATLEQQKIDQQEVWQAAFTEFTNAYNQLFDEMQVIYQALETEIFNLVNNNFDDWSVKRGTRKDTIFLENGNIDEQIIVIATDFLLAEKKTEFNIDDTITERVQFYPWTHTEGSNIIQTLAFSIVRNTIFNDDDSVTELIS